MVRQAEHRDAAAVRHVADHVAHRARLARHLEADVEALLHAQLVLCLPERGRAHVHRPGDACFARELEAVVAHVGDDDEAGPVVASHLGSHDPDRPGAGDQHVLRDQPELGRGVDRVAERIEDRRHVEVDLGEVRPQVAGRHDDELGEGAIALDSDADGVCAQGAAARHAVAAAAADDVAFGTHDLAGKHRRHAFAQLDDLAHELVADHERRLDGVLGPLVPAVDVQVGAADPCAENAKQHLTRPWLGLRHVLEPEARLPLCFDQRLHWSPLYIRRAAVTFRPRRGSVGRSSPRLPSPARSRPGGRAG